MPAGIENLLPLFVVGYVLVATLLRPWLEARRRRREAATQAVMPQPGGSPGAGARRAASRQPVRHAPRETAPLEVAEVAAATAARTRRLADSAPSVPQVSGRHARLVGTRADLRRAIVTAVILGPCRAQDPPV